MDPKIEKTYTEIKTKHPDTLVLIKDENGYYAINEDAEKCAKTLSLSTIATSGQGHEQQRVYIPDEIYKKYLPQLAFSWGAVNVIAENGQSNTEEAEKRLREALKDLRLPCHLELEYAPTKCLILAVAFVMCPEDPDPLASISIDADGKFCLVYDNHCHYYKTLSGAVRKLQQVLDRIAGMNESINLN